MFDESSNISAKTWKRTVESINKVGYSDGVVDGQSSSFQSSFDMGYAQGLRFGLELGFKSAIKQQKFERPVGDSSNINCQICINGNSITENIVNLYNIQKEKNEEYLETSSNKT
ncbi:unnamed protein product [Euphydryas editha]|uniref:Essential protein Yae1 N-terminal domain-containing protein n=1 Tax=Euphydryas editha TaxID=104508 RepID=A0AAU9U9U2_EUPED|nr:unnamed protein product [Euphydryas editha]